MDRCYGNILDRYRKRRKEKFKKMEGYLFGEVLHFDNDKGYGVVVDDEGNRLVLHYKNMDRINYKVVSKGQRVHFKPGRYKHSIVALDVALVH
jgi:cold shock CspA family protein